MKKNARIVGAVFALAVTSCAADTDMDGIAESESASEGTSLIGGQNPEGAGSEIELGVTHQGLYHNNCDARQTRRLSAVATVAARWSIRTRQLIEDPTYQSLVEQWLGRPADSQRMTHASRFRAVMNAVHARLTSGDYGYDCYFNHPSCFDGVGGEFFARAHGSDTVRTCAPFWRAGDSGFDSAPGTLLHELTHFSGTQDLKYGQDEARNLARSDPMSAIQNADNYQYLYESLGNR